MPRMNAQRALSEGIKRLRKERGWTQAHLAETAQLSIQFLGALEQGKKSPSIETLDALTAAFRVSTSELFAAGEVERPSAGVGREVLRAVAALPREAEKDILDLVHVVSRLLAKRKTGVKRAAPRRPATRRRSS